MIVRITGKPLAREGQGAGASVGRRRERVGPVVSRQPCGWWWQDALDVFQNSLRRQDA